MSSVARQGHGIAVTARVFPVCECGLPYASHVPNGCVGYRPVRPVQDLGLRAYVPAFGGLAGLACRALWAVEWRFQGLRERIERR
jgi:hypothetical protein